MYRWYFLVDRFRFVLARSQGRVKGIFFFLFFFFFYAWYYIVALDVDILRTYGSYFDETFHS